MKGVSGAPSNQGRGEHRFPARVRVLVLWGALALLHTCPAAPGVRSLWLSPARAAGGLPGGPGRKEMVSERGRAQHQEGLI